MSARTNGADPMRSWGLSPMVRAIVLAAAAAVVLVAVHLAAGGVDFETSELADPCTRQVQTRGTGIAETAERVGLTALDGAACELKVSREDLLLSIAGEGEVPVDPKRRNEAFRTGIRGAIDEEQRAGRLSPTEATIFRAGLEFIPVEALIDRLFGR